MMFQPDVCCFKSVSCDLTGYIGASKKPLIGPELRKGHGSGGKPPQEPPHRGGGDDNNGDYRRPRYTSGKYVFTWKGQALLAFAAASMFLGINQAHNVLDGWQEVKKSMFAAVKQYPTNQSFEAYKP